MSKSTPTTLESWEELLEAVKDTEPDLPGVARFVDLLTDAHTRALALKAVRNTLESSAKEARCYHRESMTAGKDAALALRGFVRSSLGTRSEKLLLYGMQPLGRHHRAKRKQAAAARPGRRKGFAK